MRKVLYRLFMSIAIVIGFLALVVLVVNVSTRRYRYNNSETVPNTHVALILGAAILKNGQISPVLRDRTNLAIELYRTGKVSRILVTGDNSKSTYNEVHPIRDYLLRHGIPSTAIYLDYAGFDTYSSMYRARDIFHVQSMVIVTQSFHLPRAVFIARNLGINAIGLNADDGHYKVSNYVREVFADAKAVANLITHRKPKYLGEARPIGDV